ncbi:MAG: hypothetical protein Q4D99_05965, partial [Bacillota bacterium]|nr:hypothetical protein [Bacillota bacterium]
MKRNASVTVFLALVITCSSALICALTESARTAGARFYVNAMAGSAIDSLLSQYHPQLWECYRLLGCAYRSDAESAQEMQNFMKPYVEDCGWYAISAPTALVTQKTFMTDGGGVWFEQEVLDYLKSGWINLQLTPESAEKLWKQLKEAQAMNEIIRDYGMESREAASMEKALDRINKNLEKQTSLKRSARGCLNDWSNTRFQREASQLETTVRELPELIRKFDTKAERFAARMQTLEEKHRSSMELLEPENREVIEDQIKEYHEYTDANGLRRQKIDALDDNNENELRTITEVRDFADETEEYIDSYESDDEDDEGPDEDELWGEVADAWDCVPIPETDEKSGIASEKTVKDLEGILDMVNDGFLKC